jgi:type III pantothenate kinase
MFLAVDAGNTKITFGFFEGDSLKDVCGFPCDINMDSSELKTVIKNLSSGKKVDGCMIASVVEELTEKLRQAVLEVFFIKPLVLKPENNNGIKIKTSKPEKSGADRVANAYAASVLYDARPIIVVDSGSATTFDIVDRDNFFEGGVIMPGMELQLKTLGEKTSKLPALELKNIPENISVISDNTEEAIYSGVVVAHAQAVQGLIKLSEQKLGEKAFIVGTGGNINLVSRYMNERKFDIINRSLTLDGIRLLYDLNTKAI